MRAAPALQVTVSGRGTWRWLVVALVAASAAAGAWWLVARLGDVPSPTSLVVCIASGALTAIAAWRALRQPARHLRFDGQRWWLGMAPHAEAPARSGDVTVVMDLGRWMLVRFDAPADAPHQPCRHWLALGRDELQAHWHALRCAVYSPRPGAPSGSRAAPVDPSSRE